MPRDRWFIFASAGLRAAAVSLSGVVLSLHLSSIGFDARAIGFTISLGMAGCAIGTFLAAAWADRFGRRSLLLLLALCMVLGGIVFAFSVRSVFLMATALLGMVNGMGRDRGAGVTIEQAMLPQTTTDEARTATFAWYNLVVDGGHAIGSLLGGLPALFRLKAGLSTLASYQWTWGCYSFLCLLAGGLVLQLSKAVELKGSPRKKPLSPSTRPIVMKFAALSGLDSLGRGFLTTALLSYWFFKRFGVDESLLGPLFFFVRILNGVSHLGAAWLAKRIGLVNTMVFTHMPSSFLLMTVPFAPNLPVAIALFLLRESLVEMDVPTRQSYIVAVVKEEERTQAAGITNLTRSVAWAVSPMIGGSLMGAVSLSAPLLVAPAMKITYDLLLYRAFRRSRPPEENDPSN